jgi:chromosomal replication initiator protein
VLDALWTRLLDSLSRKLPTGVIESWFRPCRVVALEGDHVRIAAPNPYVRDWILGHHLATLQAAVQDCLGGHPRVTVIDDGGLAAASSPSPARPAQPGTRSASAGQGQTPALAEGLNPRYTFDTFVIGSSNQFAEAACHAVAELPSRAYNPLFVYGGVGLGKTHLLHAVGHQTLALFPRLAVVYVSCERFTNELINAIRYDRTAEFRSRYRTIDLLLVDDIHFISGKERTQEEFFHTFNDLYESRKQIVLSSDCSPKDIPDIEERLRSRFEWGLIADIQVPDLETRVAILKKKAAAERVVLADDVAFLIASRIRSNIRELEGSLTRMIAFCALTGREMGMELAHEVLAEIWGEPERVITIDQIQRKVADHFGVTVADLKARSRTQSVAMPRQIAMYLARQLTHASLAEVGRNFGNKDHTTVLHAVDKIQTLVQDDLRLRKTIDGLIQSIRL